VPHRTWRLPALPSALQLLQRLQEEEEEEEYKKEAAQVQARIEEVFGAQMDINIADLHLSGGLLNDYHCSNTSAILSTMRSSSNPPI
jgi:thiamine monophosphate kinase